MRRQVERQHTRQVNRAVSYHAIKSHLVELLSGHDAPKAVLEKLHSLLIASPVVQRPARASPRGTQIAARSYLYQRTAKKGVF